MYALKIAGLVVLAGTCLVVFSVGYEHFQEMSSSREVWREASQLDEGIEYVIVTGNSESVDIEVPDGHEFRIEANSLIAGELEIPEDGYDMPVVCPDLGPGEHELEIKIEGDGVKVSEVSQ